MSGAPTQRVVEPAAAVAKDPVPSSKPERSAVKAVPVLKSLDLSFLKRSPTEDRPASENAGPLGMPLLVVVLFARVSVRLESSYVYDFSFHAVSPFRCLLSFH